MRSKFDPQPTQHQPAQHQPTQHQPTQHQPTQQWCDERLSRVLQSLPAPEMPAGLATSLRVLASRESARRSERRSVSAVLAAWMERARLHFDNLMRPMAVPFAGGVLSALVLFGIWLVPTYPLLAHGSADVPTTLSTEATIRGVLAAGVSSTDVVVDVYLDDQGQMVDYRVVKGAGILTDDAVRRRLENLLLFTDFAPATAFGVPTPSRMRLSVISSRIDVKG
jgi:hypothetical protein